MKKLLVVCCILLVTCLAFANEIANMDPAPAKGAVTATVNTPGVKPGLAAERAAAKVTADALYASHQNLNGSLDNCVTPFPEDVESAVVPALPACWVQISADAVAPTWQTFSGGAHSGTKQFGIAFNAPQVDDWLFSPGVALTGGTAYQLKYWRRAYSSSYPERLDVWFGSTQDVAGMTTNIVPTYTFNATGWVQEVFVFTPASNGTYYIGFHATSEDAYYLLLDDINVIEAPSTGRCCYENAGVPACADNLQADCEFLGGVWDPTKNCTDNPCPVPCPYPNRDIEPANDYCGDVPVIACSELLCGDLPSNDDVDWYKVVIPTGVCQTLLFDVYANATTTQWPYGLGLDSYIELYASDCETFLLSDDDGGVGFDSKLQTGCLVAGTYYIAISAPYAGDFGPYVLSLTCATCQCPQDCELYVLCGTPGEVEPNETCPAPATEPVITCNSTVYGLHCPTTDHDFWKVVVPPMTRMLVSQFEGQNCDVTPTNCTQTKLYADTCGTTLTPTASTTGWTLTNPGIVPWILYLEVYDKNACPNTYKLVATCCPLTDYCATPIVVPGVTHYEATVNTCCALNVIPCVREDGCTGTCYASGPDVIFKINVLCNATLNITATGANSADEQVQISSSCSVDPESLNCVGSQDFYAGNAGGETIANLAVAPGVYYVSVSLYGTGCGDITLVIDSDCPLAVELSSFDAIGRDNEVEVTWNTASETNNDRFDVLRNGETVAQVPTQGNGANGHTYSWTDRNVINGTSYTYSLVAVDVNGGREVVATESVIPTPNAAVISEYALHQNYPNPFNPETQIVFDLVEAGNVSLKVYNLMGQELATVVDGMQAAGRHVVTFDAAGLPSGLYLYKIEANGFTAQKKMLLLK